MALLKTFLDNKFGQDVEGAYCRIEYYSGNKTSLTLSLAIYSSARAAERNEDGTNKYQPIDHLGIELEIDDLDAITKNAIAWGYEQLKALHWPEAKDA